MQNTEVINMDMAAQILSHSRVISVIHIDGMTATTVDSEDGKIVLVQGSGEDILRIM